MPFFVTRKVPHVLVFNSLTKTKEVFSPLKAGAVSMYTCGPTVYDFVHIGNLRTYIVSDIIRRTFEYAGYSVKQVMNVTDFGHLVSDGDDGEDKMTKGLRREGKELSMENMFLLASRYIEAFEKDRDAVHILKPHALPRASEHIPAQVAYVKTLLDKGYAYTTKDGVYFDTQKFPSYGALGASSSVLHSRVGVSSEKKNPEDFALWKLSSEFGWDAPWGKGFPGWHIECTAMSTKFLGKTFDVHTGGIDLKPVHHNNEIAQAEAANGKPLARFWLHNEFVTVDDRRIGKSEGNAVTLSELVSRGIHPLAFRYWVLGGHYRQPMNFSFESVQACHTALRRAWGMFNSLKGKGAVHPEYKKRFDEVLFDDFNIPKAIGVLWKLLKDETVSEGDKRSTVLLFDRVLGVGFSSSSEFLAKESLSVTLVPPAIQKLVTEREEARQARDFARADALRASIEQAGYTVSDGTDGPVVNQRSPS